MAEAQSYWSPLLALVPTLRCWVRMGWKAPGDRAETGNWGQMLIMPSKGYLEASDGPVPLRDVEWIELSTERPKGGIAGIPLQFEDREVEILASLDGINQSWDWRETVWSLPRFFEDRPVNVIRIANPFYGPTID